MNDRHDDRIDSQTGRVAAVLRQLRAGVRQRQGEMATLSEGIADIQRRLVGLRSAETLQEPRCVSPRPVIGWLVVLVRRIGFHLLWKWYAHSLLQQQNDFNRLAADLLEDLADEQQRLASRLATLIAELEELRAQGRVEGGQETEPG